MKIEGTLVDVHKREVYPAQVFVENGFIKSIKRVRKSVRQYILPGLIDSHVHIESSMITPGAFASAAVKHGTVGVVSDPHEIANVLGYDGVSYMIEDSRKVPMRFWFGAPSCVPATDFETNGARIDSKQVEKLLDLPDIKYLSEMMNFPGVISGDSDIQDKINAAKRRGKPIDGHAPGLTGDRLLKYISAGISTDHECSSIEEAREKILLGMKILIREGSAARNLNALKDLYSEFPEMLMICSDDLHPEMLQKRHINKLIAELVGEGYDIFDVIRSATVNPVQHYKLEAGLLREGDPADFILVDNLNSMNVIETWIKGKKVFDSGKTLFKYKKGVSVNNFHCSLVKENDIKVKNQGGKIRVISASDGDLLTSKIDYFPGRNQELSSHTGDDILKIVVKDRYADSPAAVGFIRGFGLKEGAIGSSIAHDSHNIICVGVSDKDIVSVINEIVKHKGGLAVSAEGKTESLALDIAGIMTSRSCSEVASDYERLNSWATILGCKLSAPFMTLSFMALLVIPALKIGDQGLFDVTQFRRVPLFLENS